MPLNQCITCFLNIFQHMMPLNIQFPESNLLCYNFHKTGLGYLDVLHVIKQKGNIIKLLNDFYRAVFAV